MFQKIIVLALLVACATANATNFGEAMYSYWQAWQKIMPCGSEAENIPPMAPLVINQQSFDYSGNQYSFRGNVSDMVVAGLSNFRVLGGSYDEATNKVSFDMIYPKLQVVGKYDINAFMTIAGLPLRWADSGLINEKCEGLRILGTYRLAEIENGQGLKIVDFHLEIYLADIELSNWSELHNISMNNFFNGWLRDLKLMVVQQIEPYLDTIYETYVLPYLNGYLSNITMDQLVDALVSQANTWNSQDCNVQASNL